MNPMDTIQPTRRDFFKKTGQAAPALLLPRLAGAAGKGPNILFAFADDWSWPFASIAGNRSVNSAAFDRVAREGVMFRHAHAVAPTCSASRASVLTGQWFARLESGADLWGTLPAKFDVYPDLLERLGYHVGFTGKGWGPGNWKAGGRRRNPAGPEYQARTAKPPANGMSNRDYAANFEDFLKQRGKGQPFCFWYGGHEPHRRYEKGSGLRAGKKLADAQVPPCLPDVPEVRSDLLDYALEIDWFNTHLERMMKTLERLGELDNTLIVVSGDNGLPFPRCKANLYNWGTNVPLAVRWGERIKGGRVIDDYISLADLAPTFLEACGSHPTPAMTARSFLDILTSDKSGWIDPKRERVFTGRERHTLAQPDGPGGYPMRAIHTRDFLYIRNYKPERFPAGSETGAPNPYWDIDNSPTKTFMMEHRDDPRVSNLFELGFGKRPAEELYDLRSDPGQLRNLAGEADFDAIRKKLSAELTAQLKQWKDPREVGGADAFDHYEYFGRK